METNQTTATPTSTSNPDPPQPDSLPPENYGPRNFVIVGVVALTVALMIFFAVRHTQLASTVRGSGSGSGPASINDLFGKQAPGFELQTLDNQPVRLAD